MNESLTQTQPAIPQTPPTTSPIQPQKTKKSLALMIAIHILAVASIGYLVYQNIQLKKQISLLTTVPITTPTPALSDEPNTEPIVVSDCSANDKYSITIKEPSQNNATSEFLVKYNNGNQDFIIKEERTFCIGLYNNFLVLDSGSSAGIRGLMVYDLDKKSKIYQGMYAGGEGKPIILNNTVSYWEPTNQVANEENCPDYLNNKDKGGVSAIDIYTTLDLGTLKKDFGETKCSYRE